MTKDIRTILNTYQLISGFVCHVFESTDIPITYLPTGWLPHIRDQLRTLGGTILIKDTWKQHSQRLEDNSIMEVIARHTELTLTGKLLVNECQMWLRIITIFRNR